MLTLIALMVTAATAAWLLIELKDGPERHLIFLMFALWLRYALSAFPEYTFDPVVAGVTINALGALATVGVGFLIIDRKAFLLRPVLPLYIFLVAVFFSNVLNGQIIPLITGGSRFLYLLVITLAAYLALLKNGPTVVCKKLLPAFMLPVSLQIVSVGLGIEKRGVVSYEQAESTGRNYVGTFSHESDFSLILLAALFVSILWTDRGKLFYLVSLCVLGAGMMLANYRTAILATAPFMIAGALQLVEYVEPKFRGLTRTVSVGLILAVVMVGPNQDELVGRFSDLGEVSNLDFFREPASVNEQERDLLTGRYYIWVNYISAWRDEDPVHRTFGRGTDSWEEQFRLYAHNAFVSYLYEYGWFGLLMFGAYWVHFLSMCGAASIASRKPIYILGGLGFTILACATMPLWQISGAILLGLIGGAVMYELAMERERRASGLAPATAAHGLPAGSVR